jgi:transposase
MTRDMHDEETGTRIVAPARPFFGVDLRRKRSRNRDEEEEEEEEEEIIPTQVRDDEQQQQQRNQQQQQQQDQQPKRSNETTRFVVGQTYEADRELVDATELWLIELEEEKEQRREKKKKRKRGSEFEFEFDEQTKISDDEYRSWLADTSDIVTKRGADRDAPIEMPRACVATDRCLPGQVHGRLEEVYVRNAESCWDGPPKIGRKERGRGYQFYSIVYPVRKVVTSFESAREVVRNVIGQHWRGFNSEELALEYLCNWEKMDAEAVAYNQSKKKEVWKKNEKIVSEYPHGLKSCTRFADPEVKEGYKYFPCANEYKTEEEIPIGGEKEAWRVTKLSNREFGRTRAQTQELEVANALEELSTTNDLENRRKEAAKVDAATSLFVLRDVEKEKGEALHFARERELVGQLKIYKCAVYPTPKQKIILKKLMVAETMSSYNFVVREINKLVEEENKLFEEKKKLREKEDAKIIEGIEEKISALYEKLYSLSYFEKLFSLSSEREKNIPVDFFRKGIKKAHASLLTNVRKRLKARGEGKRAKKFTLHERTPNVYRCTFPFGRAVVKQITRVVGAKEVDLNFSHGARNELFKDLGTVRCVERSVGDLDDKVNYGGNVNTHGEKEDRKFCQKEDIVFEFDSRTRRWFAVFVYDAPKDPPTLLPHTAKKICSLDCGVSEPVVVYDFDGAIITGLFAPPEVWKKRLKKLAKFQSYIDRLSWARQNERRRKRFEHLVSKAKTSIECEKLESKYVFNNDNGKVVYVKKTPRQFAKWKRQVQKRFAGECSKFERWVLHQHKTAAAFLADNYDAIVAPKVNFHEFNFGVSFSSKGKKNTNRIAQSYSLCAFIDCVRYAFLARGQIVVSDKAVECGTSKTCGNCFEWNEELKLNKNDRTFRCPHCNFVIHRDWNGARNNGLCMCTAGGYYRAFVGNEKEKIVKSKKFLFLNTLSETQKGEGKKERHPTEVVTRATNATRVRPEDNSSKYVTTLTKPSKGKYEVGIRVADFAHLYRVRVVTRKKLTSKVDKKLTSKKRKIIDVKS